MEEFITITQILRDQIKINYNYLKNSYFDKINLDNMFDNEENFYNENFEMDLEDNNEESTFEYDVFFVLMKKIKYSKYKKILCLILLKDVYINLKAKYISGINILSEEKEILYTLEKDNIDKLIELMNSNEDFFFDILTIYIENEIDSTLETKLKNKKILELSNNLNNVKKFKISILDDMQYQYIKTRKLY